MFTFFNISIYLYIKYNKNMDNFSLAELSGRTIFNDKLIKNGSSGITFTESKYDKVDVFWEKYDTKYVGEIKYRDNYPSSGICVVEEGAILEKTKYDELMKYHNLSGLTPYYIMIFNNNEMYLWDISELNEIEFKVEKRFPKTTKGRNTKKVEKKVAYLPLDSGIKCKY